MTLGTLRRRPPYVFSYPFASAGVVIVISNLLQDLRIALRGLIRAPAFAMVTVVTLAVAIGANTAIYSVVDAVLLKPLPYPDEDRLVKVSGR